MARRVTLITGPPCAGKTTWARDRAQPGDIVLDQDAIGAAAMSRGLDHVAAMTDGTAWVIRCCAGQHNRVRLAAQIRATDTVHLQPPAEVLLARARQRRHPARHVQAVRQWLADEQAGGRAGTRGDPQHVERTAW